MNTDIITYNHAQPGDRRLICQALAEEIQKGMSDATSKVWHGSPVWFINDNPVVGYANRKNSVQLLFWSGQSFDEPHLAPEGSFKAAETHFTGKDQINTDDLQRWLKKAHEIQWDYKNIIKRKGILERL